MCVWITALFPRHGALLVVLESEAARERDERRKMMRVLSEPVREPGKSVSVRGMLANGVRRFPAQRGVEFPNGVRSGELWTDAPDGIIHNGRGQSRSAYSGALIAAMFGNQFKHAISECLIHKSMIPRSM